MIHLGRLSWRTQSLIRYSPLCEYNKRSLTSKQVSTALRPFYGAVHPDLFGQYPKERAVNENSLKHLSEYLALRQSDQRYIIPQDLPFFIKDSNQSFKKGILQRVRIRLRDSSLHETVQTVLESCRLPLDYIKSLSPISPDKPDRPIRWDPSFYTRYNRVNPHAKTARRRGDESLVSWLEKNLVNARTKQQALKPVQEQIKQLRKIIQDQTGLVDIIWDSRWALPQFRACLKGLLRVCNDLGASFDLEGFTLVFGNDTGFSCLGNIILKVNDVEENWIQLLHSVRKQDVYLKKLPSSECYLSSLLNDVCLVRRHNGPTILASEYLNQLRKLISSVRDYRAINGNTHWIHKSLNDVEVVIECAAGPLMVSVEGFILVPASCPVFLMVDYLNLYAEEARQKRIEFLRKELWQDESVRECRDIFHLTSFTKDESVTSEQMEACCQRLLAQRGDLAGLNLHGCHIKVSQFTSVMSDGEIYIPWNWKTIEDVT